MSKSDGFGSGPPFDSQAYRDTLNFALAAPYENVLYALLTQHFYPCGPRSGMVQAHKDEGRCTGLLGKDGQKARICCCGMSLRRTIGPITFWLW